jgi:hypothetical protein
MLLHRDEPAGTCAVVGVSVSAGCAGPIMQRLKARESRQKSHAVALERQMHQSTEGTTGVKGGETIGFR